MRQYSDKTTLQFAGQLPRQIVAIGIGGIFEWYDFVVYGYFASTIAGHFFPARNETASLLAAFAAFGVGFLFRPIGAAAIGAIADWRGRKTGFILSVILMAAGTLLIGLLPPFEVIGIAAPILLVLARLLQGFSVGGEWGTSLVYLVEVGPANRRGLLGSLQQVTVVCGLLLGSVFAASLATILDAQSLQNWGWRIPFLVGGLIALVGIYMRSNAAETEAYRHDRASVPAAVGGTRFVGILQALGLSLIWSVVAYIFLLYMPTFIAKYTDVGHATALWFNSICLLALIVAIPISGHLSDRIGRKPLLLAGCAVFVVLPLPLYSALLAAPSLWIVLSVQLFFSLAVGLYIGVAPAAIAELFHTSGRATYVSTTNAVAVSIFGGFAPFIATWLIAATGSVVSPLYYVIASAVVSGLLILTIRDGGPVAAQPLVR